MNALQEIEALAEELYHLTGKDYSRYVQLWLCAEPDDRREIQAMLELERRAVAPKQQVVLAPAPVEHSAGDLELGQVLVGDQPKHAFSLPLPALLRHVTIFGQSGSGKTNCAYLLLRHLLAKHVPFLVLDWKRNYRDLLALDADIDVYTVGRDIRPFHLNPLIPPPGTSPETWLKKITEVIGHAYYVGEGVASILHRALDAVYEQFGVYDGTVKKWPTLADVRDWAEQYMRAASYKDLKAQWIASTKRTLQSLCYGDTGRVLNVATPTPVHELLTRPVVLELDALSEAEKTLIIETLLLWVHHYRLQEPTREQLKHVILIEEAHHVLRREEPTARENILDVVIREIRELGEGLIMVDQSPHQFSQNAVGNSGTSLVFALKDRSDVFTASNFLLLGEDQKGLLNELPIGVCVAKLQDGHRKPFCLRVPHVRVPKGTVTDADLSDRAIQQAFPGLPASLSSPVRTLQDALATLSRAVAERRVERSAAADSSLSPCPEPERAPTLRDAGVDESVQQLTEERTQLLKDILDYPWAGISQRFKRLDWSVRHGNRVKDALVALGLCIVTPVNKGDSQLKLIDLTSRGRQVAKQVCPDRKILRAIESRQHAYWKDRVATALADAGLHVETEKPLNGDRVDVHAENGHTTAVEIETGQSDVKKNVRKVKKAGYDELVIIPTNPKAARKIRDALDD